MSQVGIQKNNIFLGCLLLFGFFSFVFAQQYKSRSEYEKEKKELFKKIQDADAILKDTRNEIKSSEGELRALNQQIYTRQRYISNLENEINFLNNDITDLNDMTHALQRDMDTLKAEYSRMVYVTYKLNNNYNTWNFIFTSESYNQLMMRLHYLREFNNVRKSQVIKINQLKEYLEKKKIVIQQKHDEKLKILQDIETEKNKLTSIKTTKSKVLGNLSKREKEFLKKRKKWKQEQEKLESLIKEIIALEMSKGEKAITKRFKNNQHKLPWPLTRCFIARKFGKQPHPFLKKIYVNNMGLGLQTKKGSQVKSVFEGKVTTVATIPGMHKVVMVQHGDYFTVYAKLIKTSVKTGEIVSRKEIIGEVFTNADGETELEFQIWKGKNRLNPEDWLKK